ncbi:hypothetical protein Aph01nite_20630 [Acrocarpospora phusangensis]|uniref:DUF4190 domain-containing protein n=1 Tax=Acrocarpospora phusangensis TaxID=1070424 RepID=A0A919Q853_9ACTN|nr:hypothetical protein [Acrocarpospora phusangensis]GIH23753.1 hypothetical protein Aph01nite_20630 [Acrocarpospora phusangensis]
MVKMGAHRRGAVAVRTIGPELNAQVDRRTVVWATRLGFASVPLLFLVGAGVIPALIALSLRTRALADMRAQQTSGTDWGMVHAAMICAVITLITAGIAITTATLMLLFW